MSASRVILLVMDSVGIGKAFDAEKFNDEGTNTLGNIAKWAMQNKVDYALPNLARLGLARLLPEYKTDKLIGASARLTELSAGKDTTTGHWEMAATPLEKPFSTFPEAFPEELVKEWLRRCQLPGVLGNCVASGTTIIEKYAEEHIRTQKPILYTSTDSVFQVAAHEGAFGLGRLYKICEVARELTLPLRVGRVIARPFMGHRGFYKRVSEHRRDYSLEPPTPNLLDLLFPHVTVASVGKIDDIFCHRSIHLKNHTGNNISSGKALLSYLDDSADKSIGKSQAKGLASRLFIFANFIDFDQEWGHRRDPAGYLKCLKEFDEYLGRLLPRIEENDLLIITADHGNDPTYRGSDHTRENVPLLLYSANPTFNALNLGEARGFYHIAKLVLEAFGLENELKKIPVLGLAESFNSKIWSKA